MDKLIGKKLIEIRKMTEAEAKGEDWDITHQVASVLVFEDGTRIYASSDDEGNNIGTLFGVTKKGKTFYVAPDKK